MTTGPIIRTPTNPTITVSGTSPQADCGLRVRSSASLIPVPPADLESEYRQVTSDALSPVAGGVAVVFVLFVIFNCLDLPSHAVGPVVAHDVVLIVLCSALCRLASTNRISTREIYPVAAVLSLSVVFNVLLATALVRSPFYTFYIGVIVIAVGSFVLSSRWAAAIVGTIVVGWAPVVFQLTSMREFAHYAFTLIASIVVGLTLHLSRRGSHRRIAQLRERDKKRKADLEGALEEAELARESLDRKVEERTAELVVLHENLRNELEERKRVERDRIELQGRLQRAQRVESIGRLAGGIAHDFNNLLTVVSGSVQTVQLHAGLPTEAYNALSEAASAIERAAELTRQLLAFGRKQIISPTVLSAGAVIEGVRKMLQRVCGEAIELRVEVRDEPGCVYADPSQLEQVLLNLTLNAVDSMPDGGELTILVERKSVADSERKRIAPGDYVCLSISDSGTGMDATTSAMIFEPFFTTKDVGRGTGLGLAVVEGIVSQHGGVIDVTTAVGAGSTFAIYLPHVDAKAPEPAERRLVGQVDARGFETILLAEDELAVRRLAANVLKALGYNVLEAGNGQEALEIAHNTRGEIHLLVSDVMMPVMDGRRLADELGEIRPRMRVLFTSGHSQERVAAHGILAANFNFLAKPYSVDTLAQAVRLVLDGERVRPSSYSSPGLHRVAALLSQANGGAD